MTTTIIDLDDFKALDPFFRIIEKGLDGIALTLIHVAVFGLRSGTGVEPA